jgi:hypothetical protein
MQEIKNIAAALPSGKFFDELYEKTLLPWSENLGAKLKRVPAKAVSAGAVGSVLENADLVLADVSGRNASGLFAAGYALGIGKRVIFLAQIEDDFPFAGGTQTLISYSGNPEILRTELDQHLKHQAPSPSGRRTEPREKFQSLFGEILRAHNHEHRGGIEMENPQTFVLLDQDMDLALVQDLSRRARELGVRLKLM